MNTGTFTFFTQQFLLLEQLQMTFVLLFELWAFMASLWLCFYFNMYGLFNVK